MLFGALKYIYQKIIATLLSISAVKTKYLDKFMKKSLGYLPILVLVLLIASAPFPDVESGLDNQEDTSTRARQSSKSNDKVDASSVVAADNKFYLPLAPN